MVLAWCKALVRAVRGHLRTQAHPEPPRSWRGEHMATVGTPGAGTDSYQTVSIVCVPDGPADSPAPGSPPRPPAPGAQQSGGRP
jgi:hypothetical protein